MRFGRFRRVVTRRPGWVVAAWIVTAALVAWRAPSLSRLAAEGQANLLPGGAQSARMAGLIARAWPEQAYESMAVAVLERAPKLTPADMAFARRLALQFGAADRPHDVLRVLGPDSDPDIAGRLVSRDGTLALVAVPLASVFVSPAAHASVNWLEARAGALERERPAGLRLLWTGDAVIGGDYMDDVQKSLDRAAAATVALLLVVLLVVYRSLLLAMIPLITIAIGLVISRGVLAWLAVAGWEVSPLVELFLIVVLFGSGTDFCLFLAWRYGEHWDPGDPAGAMDATLRGASAALLTSAGTVIAGLSLMGTMRFKLFSSTGPSVALGLALTVSATLTLTPALLVLLARVRPHAFSGLTGRSSGLWDWVGRKVLGRPLLTWLATLALMVPVAVLGLNTVYIQDLVSEMPLTTPSVEALRVVARKFGPGYLSPLTVVIALQKGSEVKSLRDSEGLALIDDASRFLAQNRRLIEVRSATQPLGSTALLDEARISARLGAVEHGFERMAAGATELHDGLVDGVKKLKLGMLVKSMMGQGLPGGFFATRPKAKVDPPPDPPSANPLTSLVRWTNSALSGTRERLDDVAPKTAAVARPPDPALPTDPRQTMLRDLSRAADGAGQIAAGARRAGQEIASILADPVGRHALDRLLITPDTVREHPDLKKSFDTYISRDGQLARIDVVPSERMNSEPAMDQVVTLRRRLGEYLAESPWVRVRSGIGGGNAEAADIRALTRSDQHKTWLIVPAGVFLILLLTLRDPWACLNLVATMILTYAFALGVTHAVFVTLLRDEGLDWKVPYFLFVLLVAVGVDYNVFLMTRLQEESRLLGLRKGIVRSVGQTGGLITSAASITACSFASFLLSPLASIRQLGFALVVGVAVDALLVRPVLVPCGHWLMKRGQDRNGPLTAVTAPLPAHTAD